MLSRDIAGPAKTSHVSAGTRNAFHETLGHRIGHKNEDNGNVGGCRLGSSNRLALKGHNQIDPISDKFLGCDTRRFLIGKLRQSSWIFFPSSYPSLFSSCRRVSKGGGTWS